MSGKRILAISDTHCGALTGLTPPAWQIKTHGKTHTKRNKWAEMQRDMWREFKRLLKKYEPFDYLFHLGDATDGKGSRSGGTEQITCDMEEQADMAVAVCDTIRLHSNPKIKMVGVYGTPYHTTSGSGEDWDNIVAARAGWEKIGGHEWVDIQGITFDLKHKCGSTTVPYSQGTSIAKERLHNMLWAEHDAQPKSDVIIRGHVHSFFYVGESDWLGIKMPALQGCGTKFGSRQCSGVVDWGFVVIDIDKGEYDWTVEVSRLQTQKATALKL